MADQDDNESALSAFANGVTGAVKDSVSSAVKGAQLAAKAAMRIIPAPAPGEDNSNFTAGGG